MVFASAIFLFLFLPVTLGVYAVIHPKYRNGWLCIASFFFYAWGGLGSALLLLFSTVVNYLLGIGMDFVESPVKKKGILGIAVCYNLGILGFFKYFNFIADSILAVFSAAHIELHAALPSIALPIGISFFTFQIMSYNIDLYRGQIPVQKNFINLSLYIMLFPQMIAGPIVRYIDIEKEITNRIITRNSVRNGIKRFVLGLAKKMILANTMGELADLSFQYQGEQGFLLAWIGIVGYTLQIYFDFSAYSDMAIGLGEVFGFHFLENFRYPYQAASMQDFWRRWHISLTNWFRDYLYIPLGGNRKGKTRTLINNLIVFFCTGLWHGASWNFIVWGLYHGGFMLAEKKWSFLEKVPKWLCHLYVWIVVMIGWIFFRAETLAKACSYIKQLFLWSSSGNKALLMQINNWYLVCLAAALLLSVPIFQKKTAKLKAKLGTVYYEMGSDLIYILLFLLTLCFVNGSSFNPFIYFKF